jgi:outer membrane protein OmpA-like peptidoglycan-associated protein
MKKVYSTALACLFAFQLLAQSGGSIGIWFKSTKKQGDWYYSQYAYLDALQAYQKAYQKDTINEGVKVKIADSYHKLNKPEAAAAWYGRVLGKDSLFQAAQMLHFAQALGSTGNYAEADQWYKRYQQQMQERGSYKGRKAEATPFIAPEQNTNAHVLIAPVAFNSPAADFSPGFYHQGLVFVSGRTNNQSATQFKWDQSDFLNLYHVSLSTDDRAARPKEFSSDINSPYHEGPMIFYQHGEKLIFTRNNYISKRGKSSDGVTKLKLMYSEKTAKGGWSKPVVLPFNSDEYSSGHPAISQDGTVLYFASDRPGGFGGTDLYKSVFKDGQWQEPVNLGDKINTDGNEMFPFLHQDQFLYFASNGHPGLGGLDVFAADLHLNEYTVLNLGAPINTRSDDFGLIIANAGNEGYFSSNREGGAGNDDVYSFITKRPFFYGSSITGTVQALPINKPLAAAVVSLLDDKGMILETQLSNEDGSYFFKTEALKKYQLKAEKEGYLATQSKLISLKEKETSKNINLQLQDKNVYLLHATIQDAFSGEPIPGVMVRIKEAASGALFVEEESGLEGDFIYRLINKKPQENISYQLKLTKNGYLSKRVHYSTTLGEPGVLELHELLKSSITKIELGMDVGKFIGMNPIYFDLGKSAIRPDAAAELDKVVVLLKENPEVAIELGSHTDARGSSAANLQLSEKRAQASVAYIISKGIDVSRIKGKGYGESQIMNHCQEAVNCSEAEHQENRRTVLKIVQF